MNVRIVSARAGNVIGGGDWAADRIVPDCVRAWSRGEIVKLRSPYAIRPWQHVLEPLSAYLNLASSLNDTPNLHGEAFNFGPSFENNHTVFDLVQEMGKYWDIINLENGILNIQSIAFLIILRKIQRARHHYNGNSILRSKQ